MKYGLFAILELLLVFGVAWGVFELLKLRRYEKRSQESRPPDPPQDAAT